VPATARYDAFGVFGTILSALVGKIPIFSGGRSRKLQAYRGARSHCRFAPALIHFIPDSSHQRSSTSYQILSTSAHLLHTRFCAPALIHFIPDSLHERLSTSYQILRTSAHPLHTRFTMPIGASLSETAQYLGASVFL
jgi:hypothetical protein